MARAARDMSFLLAGEGGAGLAGDTTCAVAPAINSYFLARFSIFGTTRKIFPPSSWRSPERNERPGVPAQCRFKKSIISSGSRLRHGSIGVGLLHFITAGQVIAVTLMPFPMALFLLRSKRLCHI